ncbi:hypothetical protein ELY21_06175 [Legionella sp. km535]|nr:hypothetical protein ELY21_06175 [Legionella sp. km535]
MDNNLVRELTISEVITGMPVSIHGSIGYRKTFKKDIEDHQYFYDFLQPFINMPNIHNEKILFLNLNRIQGIIDNSLCHKEIEVRKKYEWLASYYNLIVKEYSLQDRYKLYTL